MAISLKVNGVSRSVTAEPDTPLLYVLRNDLELNGAKIWLRTGPVRHLHRADRRQGRALLRHPDRWAPEERDHDASRASARATSCMRCSSAFIEEQAAQCGYCTSGMIMSAKELLDRNPRPSEQDVRAALEGNLCRCGTHNRIIRAVLRAAQANGRT